MSYLGRVPDRAGGVEDGVSICLQNVPHHEDTNMPRELRKAPTPAEVKIMDLFARLSTLSQIQKTIRTWQLHPGLLFPQSEADH